MKMTDVKEKTPNKRKSLANVNDSSAKKAKFTPQKKQNGTPKAQNKKTPAKQSPPGKNTDKASNSSNKLKMFPGTSAAQNNNTPKSPMARLKKVLISDNKEETVANLTKKIEEMESKGGTSKNAINKLKALKKLLRKATGAANDTPTPAKKGKGKKAKVEKVVADEEEEDEDEVENEEAESSDEEAEAEAADEEESEDDEEEDSEEAGENAEDAKEDSDEAEEAAENAEEESEDAEESDEAAPKQQNKPNKKLSFEERMKNMLRENCVFVRIPTTATDTSVREYFKDVGEIVSVSILTNKETGQPYGRAYIQLPNKETFVKCFNFHGETFDGTIVTVHPAENRKPRKPNNFHRGPGQKPYNSNYSNNRKGNFTPNNKNRNFSPNNKNQNFSQNNRNNFGPRKPFNPHKKNAV